MTLKMTSAQVVETSVVVNNNSSFQNYTNPDDHTQQTTDTPGFKPFTVLVVVFSFFVRLHFSADKKVLCKNFLPCSPFNPNSA